MNSFHFEGRLAKAVTLAGRDDKAVAKLTLIRNQYKGVDEERNSLSVPVSIQFTAFRKTAEAIAQHCFKGDQLIISARVENNNYTDSSGTDQYGFNFIVENFDFGAPGQEKRAELDAQRRARA